MYRISNTNSAYSSTTSSTTFLPFCRGTNSTDTTTVPKEWFDYLAHGTYADFLRSEGQQEKAAMADAESADLLNDELLRVSEQLPAFLTGRTSTNANMQYR